MVPPSARPASGPQGRHGSESASPCPATASPSQDGESRVLCPGASLNLLPVPPTGSATRQESQPYAAVRYLTMGPMVTGSAPGNDPTRQPDRPRPSANPWEPSGPLRATLGGRGGMAPPAWPPLPPPPPAGPDRGYQGIRGWVRGVVGALLHLPCASLALAASGQTRLPA